MHEDNLLASRVSVFLLAQSILIAVTASLINTFAGPSRSSSKELRPEIFTLSLVLTTSGLCLTLISWYIFALNFHNIGITMDLLEADPLYVKLRNIQAVKRESRRYFRKIFRRKGMNWIIINGLSTGLITIWVAMGSLLVASFVSLQTSVTQLVTTSPVFARPGTTISDCPNGLTCRNPSYRDRLRRNQGAWRVARDCVD